MRFRRQRNFLGETTKAELERRVNALEIHIQDTEARFAELENRFLVSIANHLEINHTMSVPLPTITTGTETQ